MKKSIKFLSLVLLSVSFVSCYDFDREQAEKDATSLGKQILLKSQSSKQAKIEEAKADFESAKLDSQTREIEANAKANTIKVVSKAIRENPEYLKYQLIESMKGSGNRIYIPTEAGVPIIERR